MVILAHIFRFIFLLLLQVLVLNNIQLSGYINPSLYVLFILTLPFNTHKALVLLWGFLLGLGVDIFSDTGGIHAAATVLMGFLRHFVLHLLAPPDGYQAHQEPSWQYMGLKWFSIYSGILTIAHHLFLFYLEVFRFSEFFSTLSRAIANCLVSLLLIFVSQFFFTKSRRS